MYISKYGLWSGITVSLDSVIIYILVDLNQCAVAIDGVSHTTDGVHLNKSDKRVLITRNDGRVIAISVLNGEQELMLEVHCETRTLFNGREELLLKVTRTLNSLSVWSFSQTPWVVYSV